MSTTNPLNKDMTAQEFADSKAFCQIKKLDNGQYGMRPYHLLAFYKDGMLEVSALIVDGVQPCYDRMIHYVMQPEIDSLFLAMDFPPTLDIPHDFIGIYVVRPLREVTVIAVPYNINTGERYPIIEKAAALAVLKLQFSDYAAVRVKQITKEMLSSRRNG